MLICSLLLVSYLFCFAEVDQISSQSQSGTSLSSQTEEFIDRSDDEVFLFNKSLLDRLNEMKSILCNDKKTPASAIKKVWSLYLEVAMEPVGWQAIWQVSRSFCDKLNIRFPCKVMGTIEQVFFLEHSANFIVEAVQENNIELPEKLEVPLVDLWPLKTQENTALVVEMTARALDQLRFFYNHIWMFYDANTDDDIDWPAKNLESRLKFYCHLVSQKMNPALVSYVRHLLTEAQYMQALKEKLEAELGDKENEIEVEELMRLNYRLNRIANEIETIENPVLRSYFEKIKFERPDTKKLSMKRFSMGIDSKPSIFAICPTRPIGKTTLSLQSIESEVGAESEITIKNSFKDLLDNCSILDKVFLLPGKHYLTFSEYLFGKGQYMAVEKGVDIEAKYSENVLFTIHGNFHFENLNFVCDNVRTGITVKGGTVTFKNCTFNGVRNSIGVIVAEGANASFEDCVFRDFSTGILTYFDSTVCIKSSSFDGCCIGVNVGVDSFVTIDSTKFSHHEDAGIFIDVAGTEESLIQDPTNDELVKIEAFLKVKDLEFGEKNKAKIIICYKRSDNICMDTCEENQENNMED